MNMNIEPEGDHIYDLYLGADKPHIIRIALDLDVFSRLEAEPTTVDGVAQACGCSAVGMSRLLNYLTSLQLLVKKENEYSLSCDAATFLVRGKRSYVGDLIMHISGYTPWESVRDSIRSGVPREVYYEIHFAQDAWIESYRSRRIPSSLEMWAKLGVTPSAALKLNILDVACGCGIKSMVLVRESGNVYLTCLDSPLVLEVAHDLASRWGILPKVRFMVGDLLTIDPIDGKFDYCLLGQITHYLTRQQDIDLFKRIRKALVSGGALILDVPMASGQLGEASSFLSLLLWANSGGEAYSFAEYKSFLEAAGFTMINQLSERLLSARK